MAVEKEKFQIKLEDNNKGRGKGKTPMPITIKEPEKLDEFQLCTFVLPSRTRDC